MSYTIVTRSIKKLIAVVTTSVMHRNRDFLLVLLLARFNVPKFDDRLTVHQIDSRVGFTAASVFRILKRYSNIGRITARWLPRLLSDTQKHVRLETIIKMLKMIPKYQIKQVFTRFEPVSPMFTIKQLKSPISLTTAPRRPPFRLTVFVQHNKSMYRHSPRFLHARFLNII